MSHVQTCTSSARNREVISGRPDPNVLATRIYQIQHLARAPYRVARQAALQNPHNLQAALGTLGHAQPFTFQQEREITASRNEPLSVRLDRVFGLGPRPRADMPGMRGGMMRGAALSSMHGEVTGTSPQLRASKLPRFGSPAPIDSIPPAQPSPSSSSCLPTLLDSPDSSDLSLPSDYSGRHFCDSPGDNATLGRSTPSQGAASLPPPIPVSWQSNSPGGSLSQRSPASDTETGSSPSPRGAYVNVSFRGLCMLFKIPLPATGADLHNLLSTSFGGTELQLTCLESGRIIAKGPEPCPSIGSDVILAEAIGPPMCGGGAKKRPSAALVPQGKQAAAPGSKRRREGVQPVSEEPNSERGAQLCRPIAATPEQAEDREEVVRLLNNALKECLVHGRPLRVKATRVARKDGCAYQLRCDTCRHDSCTWTATAKFDASSSSLQAVKFSDSSKHGELQPAQAEQPKSARSYELCEPILVTQQQAENRDEVTRLLNAALESCLVHGQPLKIKATPVARKKGLAYQLRCASCRHSSCTWRATANFHEPSSSLRAIQFSDTGKHGDPSGEDPPSNLAERQDCATPGNPAPSAAVEESLPRQARAKAATPLCEPICMSAAKASVAVEVEREINRAFADCQPTVHGLALSVKATAVERKSSFGAFQLRCDVCKSGTCTWRATASYDASCQRLQVFQTQTQADPHGRPKGEAVKKSKNGKTLGRKCREEARSFPFSEKLSYPGAPTQKNLHSFVADYFEKKPLSESLLITCKAQARARQGLVCTFACGTHYNRATLCNCKWSGRATLVCPRPSGTETPEPASKSRVVLLRCEAPDGHAPHERQLFGTLTWRQRQVVLRAPDKSTEKVSETINKLPSLENEGALATPPRPVQLNGFMQRFRRKAKGRDVPEFPASNEKKLDSSHFDFLQSRLNHGVSENTRLSSLQAHFEPDDTKLRVVDMRCDSRHVCAPLVCPALLHRVFSLLPEPWNLKISADGKYRLLWDSYVLISLGINIKNWSRRKDAGTWAFRSSYLPLAFAIADQEHEHAYGDLAAAVQNTARRLGHKVESDHILQWHGDMHKGIEAARKRVAPSSRRLADWAHVTGATSQGPAGLHGLLVKHLSPGAQSAAVPFVLQWSRLSKTMPKYLFHVVWTGIFAELVRQGESSAVKALQRQYFFEDAADVWDAPWRSGADCIMPGTDAGSAPQESWHNAVVSKAFEHEFQKTPYSVAQTLANKVVSPLLSQLQAMSEKKETLQDWPRVGSFIDPHTMKNETALAKEGRTCAQELLRWGLHSRTVDTDGTVYMLFPTSKAKVDWQHSKGKKKCYKPRTPVSLAENAVQLFKKLMLATSVKEVEGALTALGLFDESTHSFTCWRKAAKTFDDWRLVVHGPATKRWWKVHHIDVPPVDTTNKHYACLCLQCPIAATWGPCEHAYACLEHEGHINATALPKAKAKGRPPKLSRAAVTEVRPGLTDPAIVPGPDLLASASAASSSSALPPARDVPFLLPQDAGVKRVLRAAGLGHHAAAFARHGATLEDLASFGWSDFYNIFNLTVQESRRVQEALKAAATSEKRTVFVADVLNPYCLSMRPRTENFQVTKRPHTASHCCSNFRPQPSQATPSLPSHAATKATDFHVLLQVVRILYPTWSSLLRGEQRPRRPSRVQQIRLLEHQGMCKRAPATEDLPR